MCVGGGALLCARTRGHVPAPAAATNYNVYSKPWRSDAAASAPTYRPHASGDGELSAEAAEEQMRKL